MPTLTHSWRKSTAPESRILRHPTIKLLFLRQMSFPTLGKPGTVALHFIAHHVDKKLVALSFITVGELLYGAAKDNWTKAKLEKLKARLRSW